jgi:hypothetical protein
VGEKNQLNQYTTTKCDLVHLGMRGFIPSHSPIFLGAWDVTPGLPSWPSPLQALALVASPRLGLWQLVSYITKNPQITLNKLYASLVVEDGWS